MSLCIQCMQREGDPRNGGLCYTCAPPLKLFRWLKSRSGAPFRPRPGGDAA